MTTIPDDYMPPVLNRVSPTCECYRCHTGRLRDAAWRSDLRARLAAKDAEIADLTRRLAACVELPELEAQQELNVRCMKDGLFVASIWDDNDPGYEPSPDDPPPEECGRFPIWHCGDSTVTPAAAIAALRQKMEQA